VDVCLIEQRKLPKEEQVMKESYQGTESHCAESADDSDQHRDKCQQKRIQGWVFGLFILHAAVLFVL
jgi:hypothetical protein